MRARHYRCHDSSYIIVIFMQRIVEDRVSNPHGEHAEDVWILRGASVINSVISKPDLYLRIGEFQH